MRLLDVRWTLRVNLLRVQCVCKEEFEHRTDRWTVRCPACAKTVSIRILREQRLPVRDGVEEEIAYIQRTRPLVQSFMKVVQLARKGELEACQMHQCAKCRRVFFSDEGVERNCRKCGGSMDPARVLLMSAKRARQKFKARKS